MATLLHHPFLRSTSHAYATTALLHCQRHCPITFARPHTRPWAAGYKEKNRTDTEFDRAEIVPCGKGEVSFWTGTGPYTRTPANSAQTCQACTANTYAPRTGAPRLSPLTVCQLGASPAACRALLVPALPP